MEQFTLLAQTPGYNCAGADASTYGANGYGTCATSSNGSGTGSNMSTGTTQPGAPNTGEFFGFVTSGAFSVLLPLVIAVVIVSAATVAVIRKKRASQHL